MKDNIERKDSQLRAESINYTEETFVKKVGTAKVKSLIHCSTVGTAGQRGHVPPQ